MTDLRTDCTYPKELKRELIDTVPGYKLFPNTLRLREDRSLYFRDTVATLEAQAEEALYLMRREPWDLFFTLWQVGDRAVGLGDLAQKLGDRLSRLASVEKLEGFSLREMFSEVFARRTTDELDAYLIVGTARTTPPIEEATTGWPKPWLFLRVFGFLALVYFGFYAALQQFLNPRLLPLAKNKEYKPPAPTLPRIPGGINGHELNWVDAIRGRQQASSPIEYAAPLVEVMLLGIVALRAGAKLHYDAETVRVTNNLQANQYLGREYRTGW